MAVKEYLQQYEVYQIRAERLQAEYDKEAEMIEAITSPQGSDGQPHGSGVSRAVEARAVKLAERLTELEEARYDALRIRVKVFRTIETLPERYQAVIYQRYINLLPWDQVAEVCIMSERTAYRIHTEAIDYLENNFDLVKVGSHWQLIPC